MKKMKLLLAAAAAAACAAASPALATTFAGDYTASFYTGSDNGLTIATTPLNPSFGFNLNNGQSTSVNLFNIYTPEGSINADDKNPQQIKVAFNFTAPSPGFGGSIGGSTVGQEFLFGLYQDGAVTWANGGNTILHYDGGALKVHLNDATFNSGLFGLDGGKYDGATITATFGAAVPEPGTWALMIVGIGGVGFALRRQNRQQGVATAA